jgi:hypothetical protein
LEGLEHRLALAGNVAAGLGAGGAATPRHDANNSLVITQNSAGRVVIEGRDGTTINGRGSVSFNGSGLEKTGIKLFGGSDTLVVNDLRVTADHNIEMGWRADVVRLNCTRSGVVTTVETDERRRSRLCRWSAHQQRLQHPHWPAGGRYKCLGWNDRAVADDSEL